MKKICLLALLCVSFCQLKAQNSVVFKVKYLPNHNYHLVAGIGIKANVNINGDQQTIDKISKMGIKSPVAADIAVNIDGNTVSGTAAADNSFPLNIDYNVANIKLNFNGKDVPVPMGNKHNAKIYAHVGSDGQIKIDSADGKKVNDTTERKMQQMLNMMQSSVKFPAKPMKPGESFTQHMPINIPVKDKGNVKADASATYKLISISGDLANFTFTSTLTMNFKGEKVAMDISGNGDGTMVYSIKNNFPVSKDGTFNIKLKLTADKVNVDGTAVVTTSVKGTID